jgi:DNA-binding transcriptional LysR family regulator
MDIRRLRHFVVLAETLNFSRAAERLHMTQPPLSISIRHLEQELGAPLFKRDTRRVELTDLGKAMLVSARKAVDAVDEVARVPLAVASGEIGNLAVSFPSGATHRLLPLVLPAFRERFPGVDLRLSEASSAQTLDLLAERAVDLGIIYYPWNSAVPYTPLPLERDRLVAALSLDHPLAKKQSLKLRDLADEPFITHVQQKISTLQALTLMACQRAGFTPQIVQEALRIDTIISLVRSGVGIALVPSVCSLTFGHVVAFRPIQANHSDLEIGLGVVRRVDSSGPLINSFIQMLMEPATDEPRKARRKT